MKRVVTLAKIQSEREACHHLTLLENCQIFYSHVFVFVERSLKSLGPSCDLIPISERIALLPSLMGL